MGKTDYAGCTLIYECQICKKTHTMGPFLELTDPHAPWAYHHCASAQDPHNPKRFLYDGSIKGVGRLIGIKWPEKAAVHTAKSF